MSSSKPFEMDPADVEVRLEVDDDGLAHIQSNPAVPYVLPSVEDHFDEEPSIAPTSTGVKRKRDTSPTRAQAHPAAESIDPSPWYLDPVYCNSLDSTPAIDESRLTRLGTEELEGSEWFPPPKRQLRLGAMAPLDPLELPDTPRKTTPNSRVWESHRPSNLNFTIYEDPPDQETPKPSPLQEGFHPLEEDKENIYLTQSDLESSDEEEDTRSNLTWNEASTGPRDAFGLPLNREMSDFVQPRNNPFPERHMRRGREVLRTIWVDETQVPEEDDGPLHDDSLTDAQVREIEQTEETYQRGRTMPRSYRQQLRETSPVQDPSNFPSDVRRVLDFQPDEGRRPVTPEQNEDRRPVAAEENEGRPPVTPEESEEEPQQRQPEQEQQEEEQDQ